MRKMHQFVEVEGAGTALDRMDRAEHCVHCLGIGIPILKHKKPDFQFAELLFALLEKRLLDRGHCVHSYAPIIHVQAATRRIASTSLMGSNGLTIQPVAPARRARSFFIASLSVVRTRMGTARCKSSPRTPSMKPNPSIRGMLISVIMTSGLASFSTSKPCIPSSAWTTR